MNRTLFLLRHAKSSWHDPALPDHGRPLAPRGYRACRLLADYLRREQITPELVLCSSSTRTRETLDGIAAGFDHPPEVAIEDALYSASAAELLDRLRALEPPRTTVMLIGHDPAIHELAVSLVGTAADRTALSGKFPTGALATLAVPCTWNELNPGTCTLTRFVTPKQLVAYRHR